MGPQGDTGTHYVRALNMKHTLELVFIEHYAMLFCSTYKMAAQTHAVGRQFCQLRKWPPAHIPEHVYRPVRTLVLIITLWVSSTRSLACRAECITFLTFYEAIMVHSVPSSRAQVS